MYELSYLKCQIWNVKFKCHIWTVIFELPYLNCNIWTVIFEQSYLNSHIWIAIFELSHSNCVTYNLTFSRRLPRRPIHRQGPRWRTPGVLAYRASCWLHTSHEGSAIWAKNSGKYMEYLFKEVFAVSIYVLYRLTVHKRYSANYYFKVW